MAGIYRRSTLPAPEIPSPYINPTAGPPSSSTSTAGKPAAAGASRSVSGSAVATGAKVSSASSRSSAARNSSREHRDLSGRWLADVCSNCYAPTKENDLYCSEECHRQELEASRRKESDQIAQAFAEHVEAFQAMADVDVDDDWHRKKQHRHSFPLPFAQPLPGTGVIQSSPTDRLLASAPRSQRSGHSPHAHYSDAQAQQLTSSAIHGIQTIYETPSPFSRRRFSHAQRPRPPASDASSSSMASLPQPARPRHPTSKSPNALKDLPSNRSSSTSSLSSAQQRSTSSGVSGARRSRSRSSTMSETTSTSDDAYTTGPGTPSPAIQPDGGLFTAASLGFPGVIHEDDTEPTLLSLPPSIRSPGAVLLSHKAQGNAANGAKGHVSGQTQDDLERAAAAQYVALSATYIANRSPIILARNGSKSNPSTPWRHTVGLPDPNRQSPAMLPVLSPATQTMRFARRPSSTAMPRSAVSAAMGMTAATAAVGLYPNTTSLPSPFLTAVSVGQSRQGQYIDGHGHPVSALSSPVLTPTSSGTASTTPTPSAGHVAGLTSSSMPHALTFFRPLTSASPVVTAANQGTIRAGQGANGMARRNTRERIGFMTPAFPTIATSTATASTQTATTSKSTTPTASYVRPHNRSRSHTTSSASSAAVAAQLAAALASDSASDFARSTSEEENGLDDDDDVPSDFELDHQPVQVRGRSQLAVASPATGSGSGTATLSSVITADSRSSPTIARSSVTATTAVPEPARGRSRAQGERSSSRRGRSPPRGAARTDTSLNRTHDRTSSTAGPRTRRPATGGSIEGGATARFGEREPLRKGATSPVTARQERGRSPTIPIRPPSSVRSPAKLSPRTVAPPQPRAEEGSAGDVYHPSHALFGVDGVGAGAGVEADANLVGRPPQDGESSWERASPLAKLARQEEEQDEEDEEHGHRHKHVGGARGQTETEGGEERGRGRTTDRSSSRSRARSRLRSSATGFVTAAAPLEALKRASGPSSPAATSTTTTSTGKGGMSSRSPPAPSAAAVDPGFDDVELELDG